MARPTDPSPPSNGQAAADARARWEGLTLPPLPEAEAHERARAKIRAMTPKQKRATLIKAGIYTEDGELTEHYRP